MTEAQPFVVRSPSGYVTFVVSPYPDEAHQIVMDEVEQLALQLLTTPRDHEEVL